MEPRPRQAATLPLASAGANHQCRCRSPAMDQELAARARPSPPSDRALPLLLQAAGRPTNDHQQLVAGEPIRRCMELQVHQSLRFRPEIARGEPPRPDLCLLELTMALLWDFSPWPPVSVSPDSSESVRSVRIRSTTLARLLHGFVLLPSGISVADTGNAMI